MMLFVLFFFKQKTAYEMRISDWSSDVCSSDLVVVADEDPAAPSSIEVGGTSRGFSHFFGLNDLFTSGAQLSSYSSGTVNSTTRVTSNEIGRASCRARVCQYV